MCARVRVCVCMVMSDECGYWRALTNTNAVCFSCFDVPVVEEKSGYTLLLSLAFAYYHLFYNHNIEISIWSSSIFAQFGGRKCPILVQ